MNLSDFFGSNNAEWMEDPNRPCAQRDPEWWFDPAADLHTEAKRKPRGWAAELCADCPIATKTACLKYALDNREQWGVWGGTTAPERARLMRLADPTGHGTYAGYLAHRKADEKACLLCSQANAVESRKKRLRAKKAANAA